MPRTNPPKKNPPVTWAQAFRDVLLRLISSTKVLPLLGFVLAMTIVIKTPAADMVQLTKVLFAPVSEGGIGLSAVGITVGILGWVIALIFLLTSIIVMVISRKIYGDEITRLATERDRLQERLLKDDVRHTPPEQKDNEP